MTINLSGKTGGGVSFHSQEFTSSGSFTVTEDMQYVDITLVGAGGGGSGGYNNGFSGGGGGGGKVVKYRFYPDSSGTMTITIGALGAGGSGQSVYGNNGGNSSVIFEGMTIIAEGGERGIYQTNNIGIGGRGGGQIDRLRTDAYFASLNQPYGQGGQGGGTYTNVNKAGYCNGFLGKPGNGNMGTSIGGNGGASYIGQAGSGNSSASGDDATGYGGGGAGGGDRQAGGDGAPGYCLIEWVQ